ncbi:MAG: hypothetical protein M3P44_06910 [Actinomycetota bacterium]|nr:hypothetical protein [Actinomycetota bacterium]
MTRDTALLTLAGLGAYHGVNPAMGWLFAVSRGMQERSRRAVVGSLLPIAVGHELSLVVVVGSLLALETVIDSSTLHLGAAIALIAFGIFRFAKPRAHFRWTTMRVGSRELGLWSFLMSTAHGAGLMVAPVVLGLQSSLADAHVAEHDRMDVAMATHGSLSASALGLGLHVATMLVVMGAIAVFVYERIGLEVLRRAWVNTDHVWAGAFVLAGVLTLLT